MTLRPDLEMYETDGNLEPIRHPEAQHALAMMAEHRERQEALERDAARYRWLRIGRKGTYNKILIYAESALDRAIDEAMAVSHPPDEGK